MTKTNAEFTDDKGNRVVLSIEEVTEKIYQLEKQNEVFNERTKVTVNNGVEREIFVNEALAELWQMVYTIKTAVIFFIDLAKVTRPLILFYTTYRVQIRFLLFFSITFVLLGLVIVGVVKFQDLLHWVKSLL